MAHFPDNPGFTGLMRMVRIEGDIHDLEIEGAVPADLDGAFYRVHPDPQFPPKYADDQFFNGDGMVSQFRFRGGRIDFRQRYAQTDKWKLERAAGRSLFGAYRNPLTDEDSVKGKIRGTANTNVLVHAGKLFAMKEDSPCLIMDAETLATEGYTDFGGDLPISAFTAHPKIDPETGNFCGFGYSLDGPLTRACEYFEIDPAGKVVRRVPFEVPHYTMLHDFGITQDYALFNVSPYMSSREQLEKVEPHFKYDPSLPFYLGVLRRDGSAPIRWFRADPSFCGCHVMNAFQDGTKVHFDLPVSQNNSLFFFPDVHGHPFDREAGKTWLTRLTVDMSANSDELTEMRQIGQMPGEFPRIDDRMAGRPYRHGWMCTYAFDKPYNGPPGPFVGVLNSLTHFDLETGAETVWWAGPDSGIQEPAFIPRAKDAPEGDGYLVALVDNHITNYTDLCIFDALKLDQGPIARAKLPIRLRQGLHGNWAPAERIRAIEAAE
jgi:carotenoid cleavage dioxygenase